MVRLQSKTKSQVLSIINKIPSTNKFDYVEITDAKGHRDLLRALDRMDDEWSLKVIIQKD